MVLIASPPPLKPPSPLFRSLVAGSFMAKIAQRAKNVKVHFKPLLVKLFSQG
jgi:hypothetical protein